MTTSRADLLVRQLDMIWMLFEYHAEELDDAACLWEPSPNSWTVAPDEAGRWVADWQVPEPDPVPTTTIGWLTWHVGFWWTTTLRHCFGPGAAPAREDITWPGNAAAATEWLRGLKGEWRAALLPLTDADLDSTERTAGLAWGEGQELVNVAAWVNFELAKNVAEIGSVLHLRAATGAAPRT
ncbi:DinB family protein [Streptomyces sp. MP131-18]|uniref:DinB family protein n=1 Tax=Streptomyces sp. MP131-18 TaxID=1857892 RepID=UPI000D1AFDB9|nr:DinB family protein [Streptomyces sp. MP131-18]